MIHALEKYNEPDCRLSRKKYDCSKNQADPRYVDCFPEITQITYLYDP
jgi:hypothetical protein